MSGIHVTAVSFIYFWLFFRVQGKAWTILYNNLIYNSIDLLSIKLLIAYTLFNLEVIRIACQANPPNIMTPADSKKEYGYTSAVALAMSILLPLRNEIRLGSFNKSTVFKLPSWFISFAVFPSFAITTYWITSALTF